MLQLVGTGESCKRFADLEMVLEGLIAAGASKRSILIAFGGGGWSVDGWISRRQAEVEAGAPAPKPRVTAKSAGQA